MKTPRTTKLINTTTLLGVCFAVITLLLVIAYIPGFAPNAYDHLRQTGIIVMVPFVASIGGLSAIGWLWMSSVTKENDSEKGE